MRSLKPTETRCQDARCPARNRCARWLQRKPEPGERLATSRSLYPHGDGVAPCPYIIHAVKDAAP